MLQKVLEHIHNMFISTSYPGTYTIENSVISPSVSLKEGQRLWITGSDLNDGVYTYHTAGIKNDDDTQAAGLQDETFAGTICALAVPPAVIALSAEINTWVVEYGASVKSPYQSESVIGVYSYEKMSNSKVGGGNPFVDWTDVFKNELNRWRRVSF